MMGSISKNRKDKKPPLMFQSARKESELPSEIDSHLDQ